jgi:hypothetical protein
MRRRSAVHRDQDRKVGSEARKVSRKMNVVLARATCDLKDASGRWQNIAKDIENENPDCAVWQAHTGGRRSFFWPHYGGGNADDWSDHMGLGASS